jgi:hypothetical protein
VVKAEHTSCIGAAVPTRTSVNNHEFLLSAIPKILPVSRATKPCDVQKAIQLHYGDKVNYQPAHKALRALQGGTIEQEREEFRHLPAYQEVLKQRDPEGDFFLSVDPETSLFHRIFICPSSGRRIFQQGPHIFACDGTFTKIKFRQTLLFATASDEVILLAWALVESENESA